MSETQNNTTLSQKEALAGIRWNEAGLVPAVVQDASSLEVLMVAYMNSESLQLSLESGKTWFWSRSRSSFGIKAEPQATHKLLPPYPMIVIATHYS